MSIEAMAWAWKQTGLSPSQRIVLFYLADCHNGQNGICCPKVETIAKWSEMSKSTAQRRLGELKELGLITWKTKRDRFKVFGNHYFLPLVNSQPDPIEKVTLVDSRGKVKQDDSQEPESVTVKKKNGKATQEEILQMVEVLGSLSREIWLEYEQHEKDEPDKIPLDGRMINIMKPLIRSHGKEVLLAATKGWRGDSFAVQKKLCWPQHVFKYLEKYSRLGNVKAKTPYRNVTEAFLNPGGWNQQ